MNDYDFDLGSFDDLAAVDLGGLENIDFGNVDFGSNFDLGSFENLSAVDNLDLGSLGSMDFSSLDLGGLGNLNLNNIDVGGKFDYDQPLDQRGLNSSFAGNGPSIFDGLNMTSNSDKLASIAQMARIISQGVPLGGGYIKPARFGPGYGFNWTRKFNGGGMVKRFAEGGYNFDLGSFDDLAAVDALNNIDLGNLDFGSNFDLGSFDDLAAIDSLNSADFGSNFDLGSFEDLIAADLANIDFGSNFDLGSFEDLVPADLGKSRSLEINPRRILVPNYNFGSTADLGSFEDLAAVDSLASGIDLSKGMDFGGLGLSPTGRGQMSIRDSETGATGLTAEGFTSLKDLLGSGTAEEITRYTPGTADYSIRSGLETSDGQGLSADATRGMGLKDMGGAQGLSRYIPAEYGSSVLEDLVKRNSNRIGSIEEALPNQFGGIEEYVNSEIFGDKGLTPFKGTGGTLSQTGFLSQSSAENPLGAKYSLGDPNSSINRSSITGQQATVSPDRTVINNGDGTFKVVTVGDDGKVTTRTIDNTKTIDNTRTTTTPGGRTNTPQGNMSALLPLLLALLAMNKGGGGGGGGQSAVIPGLTATQRQTPYAQQQRAPGYRPGQGGITYFDQTQYAPRMAAGGGISRLLNGPGDGVSDSIPAVIDDEGMAGGGQPAKLARGEYVIDARTVAALGNGSTDAGAERLDKMRKNILRDDRKAGVGKDSKAYRHLLA